MNISFPSPVYRDLFRPKRYKVYWGGRGSAKSWSFARALLAMGTQKPLRVLCAREFQNSIRDSVKSLLDDQIALMGLQGFYSSKHDSIEGVNGTQFTFVGLKRNPMSLKSYEGVDICWVEEAQTVSRTSWNILVPTIRKEGSEIWVSFNPQLETDETYERFIKYPPTDSIVRKVNWSDNEEFPAVLDQERLDLKERDPDAYLNVWEGHCLQALEGAVYARELREAQEQGRITKVPYDASKGVSVFCDLGHADKTVLWFGQAVSMEFRMIDYLENRQVPWNWYLKQLQARPYVYDMIYLPHDGNHKQLASGRSIAQMTKQLGYRVKVLPRPRKKQESINALRTMFPQVWFDAEKCEPGIQALRHYRYDVDEETGQFSNEPLHDDNSHAADALQQMGAAFVERRPPLESERMRYFDIQSGSWMG